MTNNIHPVSGEMPNDDRAEMVAQLVLQYAQAYYWGGEYIETIVQDIISNLGHFLDRSLTYVADVDIIDVDPEERSFNEVLAWAERMYHEEVGMELGVAPS